LPSSQSIKFSRNAEFLSRLTFQSHFLNHAIVAIVNDYIFKGVLLIALLWWIWFKPGGSQQRNREIVTITLISGLLALVLGRLMAHYLPFRLRPMYTPEFQGMFHFAGVSEPVLRTWSAFPSDHAMLWCAIATGIFFASWRAGIYSLLHALILICLPRVFLGLHFPSDVLAGALIGIVLTCAMNLPYLRTRGAAPILAIAQRYSGLFYGLAFILSFELATQFDELRELAQGMTHVI